MQQGPGVATVSFHAPLVLQGTGATTALTTQEVRTGQWNS